MLIPFEKRKQLYFRRKIAGLLKDWYGEEAAENEITAHLGKCIPIKDAVNSVLAQIEFTNPPEFENIVDSWPELCGAAIAKYTKPLELSADKILTIGVSHSAFLRELQPVMQLILRKIQQRHSPDCCKEIKLVCRMSR